MHRFVRACLLAISCLAFTACQSSALKDFSTLKFGMEKTDVLEAMGNPRRTQRFHGKDRWTYVFYDKQIRFEKEIQFFEGNAIYIGDPWEPKPENSAYYVDNLNEAKNKALDEQMARDTAENRKAYHEYEAKVRGTSAPAYVPDFKPLQ